MGLRQLRWARRLALFIAFGFIGIAWGWSWAWSWAWAEDLRPPAGVPILTVTGAIAVTNAALPEGAGAVFDRAMLQALPAATVRTTTPWTEGERSFQGVLIRDLLTRLGAKGATVAAAAIDDYRIDIPVEDFSLFDVVLAYAVDGTPLPPDDKGPLWIIYPFSSDAALNRDIYFARSVWQLDRLIVR